jgi:hypothetical protein
MARSNGEKIAELLVKANEYVNKAYQIALANHSTAVIEEKPKKAKKPAEKREWKLDAKQRGRVPGWVLKQHNAADKADLLKRFGDGHKFAEK